MADRGRDLKISFLSDSSNFDADDPARQLDDLAGSADDAAKSLDRIDGKSAAKDLDKTGDAAKATGKDLDKLGADAKATAGKVDAAFDSIARSAKTKIADPVKSETHKAGQATAEFKDEAKQNLSEVASSFTGDMQGAADLIQGTLGGIVSAMGPVGAAIGAAGAVGVGLLVAQLQKAQQRAKDMFDAIAAGSGTLDDSAVFDRLKEFAADGTLAKIRHDADQLGVSYQDLAAAYAGNADALARVLPGLDAAKDAIQGQGDEAEQTRQAVSDYGDAVFRVTGDLSNQNDVTKDAVNAYGDLTAATKTNKEAVDEQQAALQAAKDASDAFYSDSSAIDDYFTLLDDKKAKEQESAQSTADKTKDQKDSWQDYVKDVGVSLDEYLADLDTQVKAQETWATNLGVLAKRGVDEGIIAQLRQLGPKAAPLVAQLATASEAKLGEWKDLMLRSAKSAGQNVTTGFQAGAAGAPEAAWRAAKGFHDQFNAYFAGNPLTVGINVSALNLGATKKLILQELSTP